MAEGDSRRGSDRQYLADRQSREQTSAGKRRVLPCLVATVRQRQREIQPNGKQVQELVFEEKHVEEFGHNRSGGCLQLTKNPLKLFRNWIDIALQRVGPNEFDKGRNP